MGKTYYETLGVSPSASTGEIKKTFRKLSLKHHPDRGGNIEKFKEINAAYSTLGDPEKKQQYDFQLKFGGIGRQGQSPFGNGGNPLDINNIAKMFFNGAMGQSNDRRVENMMEDPIFNMLFGGGIGRGMGGMAFNVGGGGAGMPQVKIFHNGVPIHQRREGEQYGYHSSQNSTSNQRSPKKEKPKTIQLKIQIKLKDAYDGCILPIDIKRKVVENNTEKEEVEKLYVKVIEGIDDDEIILLRGKGHVNGDMKGDVKIQIKIAPHKIFERKGMDIIFTRQISFKESLVGFKFVVEHLNGKKFSMTNTDGRIVLNNHQTELPNLGMKREGNAGKLIIRFEINIPEALTQKQKEEISKILE